MENKDKYPIFSGKVVGVPAILEEGSEVYTLVDYLTPNDELSEAEEKEAMPLGLLSAFIEEHKEKLKQKLQDRVKRALIPMRLDPSIISGADIRTRFGELNEMDYGEGLVAKTYELEVIKGRPKIGDIFGALSEPDYIGFRYIKILRE